MHRKSPVRRWFHKNRPLFILIGIAILLVLFGFVLGRTSTPASASHVDSESKSDVISSTGTSIIASETEPTEDEEWTDFTATAYCPCEKCCGKWAINRPTDKSGKEIVYTASGAIAKESVTIAADWSVLPCGTVVEIKGLGEYIVQDRGGNINGNQIDIYFANHEDAVEFGVQTVSIRVIDK